jgi:catechol 2,3-dioxygenase-like lactoylglutathione lyase family enzyme
MAVTGPLSHIDISVGYPERSIPFYAALLEGLGYRRWNVSNPEWQGASPRRATWGTRYPGGVGFAIEVRPARSDARDRRYDRYEPGPHHLAFHAATPSLVDEVHAALVRAGATILDPPRDYSDEPGYTQGYYALFVEDPDGVKLEVACIPPENP